MSSISCRSRQDVGGNPGETRARALLVVAGVAALVWLVGTGCSKSGPEPDPFYRVLAEYSQCVGALEQSNASHDACNASLRTCICMLGGTAADGGAR